MINNKQGLANQVRGIFSIARKRGDVEEIIREDNMVVDTGLAAILQPAMIDDGNGVLVPSVVEYARILKVSNDRDPITAETTTIGSVVATKNTSLLSRDTRDAFTLNQGMAEDDDGKYLYSRNEWMFEPGDIPTEISKIGVYSVTFDELNEPVEMSLYAATMLTDTLGEVTSLTPFADESFAITYESRWYLPDADVVISSVDLKAVGTMDITVRAAGIPTGHPDATSLLAATSAQFSHNVLVDYDSTHAPAIVFSSAPLRAATEVYDPSELFLDTNRDNYTVIETTDATLGTLTISVHLNRDQIWPSDAQSAVLYTSRGLYYLGFGTAMEKGTGSRRTIQLNLTFNVGRKI